MFCNVLTVKRNCRSPNGGLAMSTLLPRLDGRHVRLEPLQQGHAAGLAEAAAGDPSLYQLSTVPQGEAAPAEYIEAALAHRDPRPAAPFPLPPPPPPPP